MAAACQPKEGGTALAWGARFKKRHFWSPALGMVHFTSQRGEHAAVHCSTRAYAMVHCSIRSIPYAYAMVHCSWAVVPKALCSLMTRSAVAWHQHGLPATSSDCRHHYNRPHSYPACEWQGLTLSITGCSVTISSLVWVTW